MVARGWGLPLVTIAYLQTLIRKPIVKPYLPTLEKLESLAVCGCGGASRTHHFYLMRVETPPGVFPTLIP